MTIDTSGSIPEFHIGDRLRKAREHAGIGPGQFADEIGVSRNTVTNYERGHVKPRKIVLNAWAMRTGVPLHWIQTGEDPHQDDGPDGGLGARPEGLEPPTFWLGASRRLQVVAA